MLSPLAASGSPLLRAPNAGKPPWERGNPEGQRDRMLSCGSTRRSRRKQRRRSPKPNGEKLTPLQERERLEWDHDLTHTKYSRQCEACVKAKCRKKQCRRQNGQPERTDQSFGGCITGDHIVIGKSGRSVGGHQYSLVLQDRFTQMILSLIHI